MNHTLNMYFKKLTNYIELLYQSFNKKVILISHSLGGPIIKLFLHNKSQSWKNKYINKWFSISGAFGGTPIATRAILTGYDFGFPVDSTFFKYLQQLQSSFPSSYYLLPSKNIKSLSNVLFLNF